MISRFLAAKGLREYVAAAKLIMKQREDCRFILVGHSDKGLDCIPEHEIDQWRQTGIEFLGQLNDVRSAIADASVYVLPSYREGTPRSVLEAMAMGRCVITTDAPGCRETVIDGINGYLVPVGNVKKLAYAMTHLADDAVLRKKMGQESRKIAEEKFSVDKVNAALISHLSLGA
jgi:glycosyltransferase involved in cell wall biosynthesis